MSRVLVVLVVVLFAGAWVAWRRHTLAGPAWRRKAVSPEGACAACGSTDLDVLAPGVYRCRACGYEGGENRGVMEAAEQRLAWEGRPWPERLAAARAALLDADRLLASVAGEIDDVVSHAHAIVDATPRLDRRHVTPGNVEYQLAGRLSDALTEVREAAAALARAGLEVPGLDAPTLPDPAFGTIEPADVQKAYASVRDAVTRARAQIEALAATADDVPHPASKEAPT